MIIIINPTYCTHFSEMLMQQLARWMSLYERVMKYNEIFRLFALNKINEWINEFLGDGAFSVANIVET